MRPTPDRSLTPRSLGHAAALRRKALRQKVLGELKQRLRLAEGLGGEAGPVLALGAPALEAALPGGGLSLNALHELAPAGPLDRPAALGFLVALMGAAGAGSGRRLLFVAPRGADPGRLDGHGLKRLGLPPERLIVAETADDAATLWTLEEALRSRAVAAVAGCLGSGLDLTPSRRLHLAAAASGALLMVLRPAGADRPNAAATRWRVGAARAARDRFGCLLCPRWRIALERCRGGVEGAWEVEFDHAARGFRLVGALGDDAFPGAGERATGRRLG